MSSSRQPKTIGPAIKDQSTESKPTEQAIKPESEDNYRAPSPSKSAKSIKSVPSISSGDNSDIDGKNPASSHAESERIVNEKEYLALMNPTLDQEDVTNYLRQKRFYLNQVWQLLSAIHRHAPDPVFCHAMDAARLLSDHISDSVVKRYDKKAEEDGRKTLTEMAAKDVEKAEEAMSPSLFVITEGSRHKDGNPSSDLVASKPCLGECLGPVMGRWLDLGTIVCITEDFGYSLA